MLNILTEIILDNLCFDKKITCIFLSQKTFLVRNGVCINIFGEKIFWLKENFSQKKCCQQKFGN